MSLPWPNWTAEEWREKSRARLRAGSAASEGPLHAAANAHVAKLSVAFRYAFARGRKLVKQDPRNANANKVAEAVSDALIKVLPPMLLKVVASGGEVVAAMLTKRLRAAGTQMVAYSRWKADVTKAVADSHRLALHQTGASRREERAKPRTLAGPIKFAFDIASPEVIEWAKKHAAELVTNVTDTTRERIRLAIEDLAEEGDWDLATDRIMAAVGDEDRAELIARHETMLAASEGQRQAWDQAVEKGLLTGDEKRTWIVTPDDRLCPICEELDGSIADLDGEYPGGYDGPPAHVACRCTEGLI